MNGISTNNSPQLTKNEDMADTANCIICYKPIAFWSGHVVKDGKKVGAGWCSYEHHDSPKARLMIDWKGATGCYGQWNEKMGIYIKQKKSWNQQEPTQ